MALGGSWDGLPSLLALNAPPRAAAAGTAMLGQLGAPMGFIVASGAVRRTSTSRLTPGLTCLVGLALSVLRRLRDQRGGAVRAAAPGGDADEYEQLLEERELEPDSRRARLVREAGPPPCSSAPSPRWPATRCSTSSRCSRCRGSLLSLGETVDPTSSIIADRRRGDRRAAAIVASGLIADRVGRRAHARRAWPC